MYDNELHNRDNDIKSINNNIFNSKDNTTKDVLLKKMFYKENEDTYKLFKNMYIRKNLIAKDYDDLKTVFLKFIPESFIKEIGNMGTDKISLGVSVKKHLNIMFLDIVGFSSISENLSPDKALLLLNVYFDGIVEIINSNGGYIDKFLGDGIMIIFDEKNSDSAIKSAIEIQNFISKFQVSEVGKKISIGIGINSGDVILGTIGSRNRMEITIIGDAVNTASRLESLTREYTEDILISGNTYDNISNKKLFNINELGLKILRGKKEKIRLYGVKSVLNIKL
ncbi:MAG: adenylate/guanylate cyclase domain-containing protein [Candidatus Gracilibacteria bacterium]|nr:adenylate/guanylate cyclase domain-containing protein [Candidatus Gracilibacteria bacterium]